MGENCGEIIKLLSQNLQYKWSRCYHRNEASLRYNEVWEPMKWWSNTSYDNPTGKGKAMQFGCSCSRSRIGLKE
ncbi:hypothetical protein Hanom_Chr06g00537181 [Helianthus anomalus]